MTRLKIAVFFYSIEYFRSSRSIYFMNLQAY